VHDGSVREPHPDAVLNPRFVAICLYHVNDGTAASVLAEGYESSACRANFKTNST